MDEEISAANEDTEGYWEFPGRNMYATKMTTERELMLRIRKRQIKFL